MQYPKTERVPGNIVRSRYTIFEIAEVVSDPEIEYGQAIFEHSQALVSEIVERLREGEKLEAVAQEYWDTPVPHVEEVWALDNRLDFDVLEYLKKHQPDWSETEPLPDRPGCIRFTRFETAVVIADPMMSFGQAIFQASGVRVLDVVWWLRNGGTIEEAADEFGTPVDQVAEVWGMDEERDFDVIKYLEERELREEDVKRQLRRTVI